MFEVDSHHVVVIRDVLVDFSRWLLLLFPLFGFPPCAPVMFVLVFSNEFSDFKDCLVDRSEGWALFTFRDLANFQWHEPFMVWVN